MWESVPAHGLEYGSTESGAEAANQLERESVERAEHREAEERAAKEVAAREGNELAAHEHEAKEREAREARERSEQEQRAAQSQPTACVVPSLAGDSLVAARRALHKAQCRLGKVAKPVKHRGKLVVIGQGIAAGHRLARGSAVSVKLGSAARTTARR
jgi:septal ring factor EnvC (AmiA/AmiB activator)